MAPPAHNNLSSAQPPESGAVTSRERPGHPAGSATRVPSAVAMGTEPPPGSCVSVDFRILGVGDEVGASKPLEDDGWGPSSEDEVWRKCIRRVCIMAARTGWSLSQNSSGPVYCQLHGG
ncbi:WAP four-disulfide core domain protein 3 isoform X3 [Peromyscus eremicus]|uniref:WAP four-disulfide core domain protein 3 isoform X3 n=1 Tax=Peromyscus eremicus TaxID=42410 RepID=UPI0027DAC740|nr:WAP four-disulfide core domain protein 3 isoform X3 [Peromyscus eremicus]